MYRFYLLLVLAAMVNFDPISTVPQFPKIKGPTFQVKPRTSGQAPAVKPVTVPKGKYETIYTPVKVIPKVPAHGPIAPPRIESLLPFNQRVQFSLFPGDLGFKPSPSLKLPNL
uniref:Hypothetical secreted peptide n=1 Tax=Simulium vittatum TaxID=7192 RepID=B5M0Q3_SIMVI|nr:hypothetical secreted peptide precursor [Simulium vittatum]